MAPLFSANHRPLVHRLKLPYLLVVPILLAIAAGVLLGLHGDVNTTLLFSQCSSHARLAALSRIPLLGPPACFLVSFFQYATTSMRAVAHMGVILAFVAALLTTALVESARVCNAGNRIIRRPTVPWLVLNLVGGTLVWDLAIVPAFLRQAKQVQAARESPAAQRTREADPEIDRGVRALDSQAEIVAIPVAVLVGFVVPSVLMLVLDHPVPVALWLFFPLWVALVRYLVQLLAMRAFLRDPDPTHLESHRYGPFAVYGVPVACSLLAHAVFIWNLFGADDRQEWTRSFSRLVEIDFLAVGATVLYWLLVEAGVVVVLAMVLASFLLGPGAGLCLAWLLREKAVEAYPDEKVSRRGGGGGGGGGVGGDEEQGVHGEETPLLQ